MADRYTEDGSAAILYPSEEEHARMPRKRLVLGLSMLLLLVLLPQAALAAADPVYSLSISNRKPAANDDITVVVQGKHLNDVYGYEVNIVYDPDKLTYRRAKAPSDGYGFTAGETSKGHIRYAYTKIGKVPGDSGNMTLVTLTFTARGAGSAAIEIADVKLVDSRMASTAQTVGVQATVAIDDALAPLKFTDLPQTHWAYLAIRELVAKQIVSGTSATTFEPNRATTRAEFTMLLVNALQLSGEAKIAFTDIKPSDWFAAAVAKAHKVGLVNGKSAIRFDPGGKITREEMVVMLMRAYTIMYGKEPGVYSATRFADINEVSAWAFNSVSAAAELQLIKGRTAAQFVPKGISSRAEAAQVIYNLLTTE